MKTESMMPEMDRISALSKVVDATRAVNYAMGGQAEAIISALAAGATITDIRKATGISRSTLYKRYGPSGLAIIPNDQHTNDSNPQ